MRAKNSDQSERRVTLGTTRSDPHGFSRSESAESHRPDLPRLVRWWRWRRTLTLELLALSGQLGLLICGQDQRDLGHHFRMRDLQFDLNFRARFRGGADCRFIKRATHGIGFAFMQRAHLIEKDFVIFVKTLGDLLYLRFLILSQIQISRHRPETIMKARSAGKPARPRTARSLREDYCRRSQYERTRHAHSDGNLFQI